MSHRTHTQQLARDLDAATGIGYQRALHTVQEAIASGVITGPFTPAGRAQAVTTLTTQKAIDGPSLTCEWRGDFGDESCPAAPTVVIVYGDEPHLSCQSHADEEDLDPLVGTLPMLDPIVPLEGGTWLVAHGEGTLEFPYPIVAWNEPDPDAPSGWSSACAWFDPEHPDTAPAQWPSFTAYYEVLCDPDELVSDDEAGAREAANEVLGYLTGLAPDPSRVDVFACEWREEHDGVNGTPSHGWALVIPVTVRAGLLDASFTGNDPSYDVSAHGIVDANSWTGAEHGWEVGCGHYLAIVPAEEPATLTLQPR